MRAAKIAPKYQFSCLILITFMNFLLNVKINFSCLTSANKFLHLLCAHLYVIANNDCVKRTVVVMLTQCKIAEEIFAHKDFLPFCCCLQLKGKELLQIYISKKNNNPFWKTIDRSPLCDSNINVSRFNKYTVSF